MTLTWDDDPQARQELIAEVEAAITDSMGEGRPDIVAMIAVDKVLELAWERVREMDDGRVEVLLEYPPVKAYGKELDRIVLRRLLGKDVRRSASVKGSEAQSLFLLECSASLPPSAVDKMDAADLMRCVQAVERFFDVSGPTVGRQPPPS